MSETIKKPIYHQTIDFDSLMREARKHITALAGEVWTDHNSADPGITQLEVLAFCIADLSYRTSFDVKDLVSGYKGNLNTDYDLPLADIALPNNPVTIKDLRKVLIDLDHPAYLKHESEDNLNLDDPFDEYPTKLLVRNAFPVIAERTEVEFFAVSKNGRDSFLTFDTSYEYYTNKTVEDKVDIADGFSAKKATDIEEIAHGYSQEKALDQDENIKVTEQLVRENRAEKPAIKLGNIGDRANRKAAVLGGFNAGISNAASTATAYPTAELPANKVITEYNNIDQIILNGLYSLQIEFEEDSYPQERFLKDLNQNYFEEKITVGDNDYTLSVLMPYWDDIKWSLKDVNLAGATIEYSKRGKNDYFIAVDKLNYDDYFYDYYAEIKINEHKLPLYVKVKEDIQDVINVNGNEYKFTANFMDWNEISNGVDRDYNDYPSGNLGPHFLNHIDLPHGDKFLIKNVGIEGEVNTFDIQTKFSFTKIKHLLDDDGQEYTTASKKEINLLTRVRFEEHTVLQDEASVIAKLEDKFDSLFRQKMELEGKVYDLLTKKNNQIYADYLSKINRVFEYLYEGDDSIWSNLGKFRNLGEDYSKFSASRVQEIALFGKLIVAPNFNVNELLADIYFRIDQFLSPLVKFNSLSEMTDKGYQFDQLFNGPLLNHGFIEDADLDNLKRRSVVYTSDLIRIIMDVPGVKAVEDFNISSYIDNRLMGRNVINCLSLTNSDIYKPRFSASKTGLQVWVDNKKLDYIADDVKKWYKEKIQVAKRQQISLKDNSQLQIPQGRDMEVESYYSIQNDFPEVYGIGPYGLPVDADTNRKGRAKQLKAFLLPFEQLLANYLKQIAHLPELFSYHRDIKSTYATQPLYDVPDVQPLLVGFRESGDTWADFKANLDNVYQNGLKEGESTEEFLSRRNRFLSHLLSRFGESFEAYSTQMFDQHKSLLSNNETGLTDYKKARLSTLEDLVEDKIAFAEDYQKVSAQRYKSFDMSKINPDRANGIWNNSNIESYKLRLCRLLGIEQVDNSSIFLAKTNDDGELIDVEGMHIVEHILLRPRTKFAQLMQLEDQPVSNANGSFIYEADKDPYSFCITIVLSKYAGRFAQESFRAFAEKLIRLETPAHIRINFNWTGGQCGKRFEAHYSEWKQNVYKMKPFIFQNIDGIKDIKSTDIAIDPKKTDLTKRRNKLSEGYISKFDKSNRERPLPVWTDDLSEIKNYTNDDHFVIGEYRRANILTLQDELVKAMETPCELKLHLYNKVDQIFTPNAQEIITYEHKTTDVHNMRVSEIGGVISIFFMDPLVSEWMLLEEFKPITKPYFNLQDFTENTNGISTNYMGKGRYRVEYAMDDRTPVSQIIDVTKEIIPVSILIGDRNNPVDDLYLDFDTENDGLFRVSNQNWKQYFLKFQPQERHDDPSIVGNGYISSIGNNLPPTLITGPAYEVDFSKIYEDYGLGKYHVTYELDGESTFADIELFLELSLKVFDQDIQLLPNEDGIIVVSPNISVVDLLMDLPGGSLSVYDLDGVSVVNPGTKNPTNNLLDLGNPNGALEWYKQIDSLEIKPENHPVYQYGHHYKFVYEFGGQEVSAVILFKAPIIAVEKPTVKLFEKGKLMEAPYVLLADGKDHEYTIEFHPKDAEMRGWIMDQGVEKVIESGIVQTDHFVDKVEPHEAFKHHGEGPIYVEVKNAAGTAELNFTIKSEYVEVKPTTLTITDLSNDKQVELMEKTYTLIYDYHNKEHAFQFNFNNGDGELFLTDSKGNAVTIPVKGNQIKLNGIEPLPEGIETGIYEVVYVPSKGNKIEFVLNVINLNPTFVLKDKNYKRPYYIATAVPLDADARTYIWRVNGNYVTRAKNPILEFDYGKNESITVELTMHLYDAEATYKIELTLAQFKKQKDDQ